LCTSFRVYYVTELQYEPTHYQQLIDGGVDEMLAAHIAHMFIRDPLQVLSFILKYKSKHLLQFTGVQGARRAG
jgi:hypothetical protein